MARTSLFAIVYVISAGFAFSEPASSGPAKAGLVFACISFVVEWSTGAIFRLRNMSATEQELSQWALALSDLLPADVVISRQHLAGAPHCEPLNAIPGAYIRVHARWTGTFHLQETASEARMMRVLQNGGATWF